MESIHALTILAPPPRRPPEPAPQTAGATAPLFRPRAEVLEDRACPSATLVQDINTIAPGFANLDELTTVGSRVFFEANDRTTGNELWVSDGTAAGTHEVLDINPGPNSSSPGGMIALGSNLLFTADDGVHGNALWVSDGTAAGTTMLPVAGYLQASDTSDLGPLDEVVAGPWLYFVMGTLNRNEVNKPNAPEIWRTDGTAANTQRLTDLNPGLTLSSPHDLSVSGQYIYFAATGSDGFADVWRTNVTDGTTVRVTDVAAGNPQVTSWVRAAGSTVYFPASDPAHGLELWASDGTPATTRLVEDIEIGAGGSNPQYFTTVGSTLYFTAPLPFSPGDPSPSGPFVLWATDGTAAGTKPLTTGSNAEGVVPDAPHVNIAVIGSTLFFDGHLASQGFTDGYGWWMTDGDTLMPVSAINAANPPRGGGAVTGGEYIYFQATDGSIWRSDGSSAGTSQLLGSVPQGLGLGVAVGADVYCATNDYGETGVGLWKLDGATGTLAPVVTQVQGVTKSSYPSDLTPVGSTLYFMADDGVNGQQLWRTDGRPGDAARVEGGPMPVIQQAQIGSWFYFITDNGDGTYTLWRNDSTANPSGGTSPSQSELLNGIATDPNGVGPYQLTAVGNDLYFGAWSSADGAWELWKVAGANAPGGTIPSATQFLYSGEDSNGPTALKAVGTNLYFTASAPDAPDAGNVLWWSDGTPNGAVPVGDGARRLRPRRQLRLRPQRHRSDRRRHGLVSNRERHPVAHQRTATNRHRDGRKPSPERGN